VSELRGEKIDIIPWNTEPARFIAKALSPARVREVFVDDETKEATVVVPEDQLALAIGKEGLNARLAARLTGWRVDIQSDQEFAQAEAEAAFAGEEEGGGEFSGRCAAILANGKRCPNASLPGSRFCGIPAHQELAAREAAGEKVASVPIAAEGEASSDEVSDTTPVSDTVSEPEPPAAEAEAEASANEEILVEATPEVGEPVHETAPAGDATEGPGPEPEVEVPVPGQETEEEQGSS
jgi:transcription termination/antitermination protein NusA